MSMREKPGSDSPDHVVPLLKVVGVDEEGEHHDLLRVEARMSTVNDSVQSVMGGGSGSSAGWSRAYEANFNKIFGAKHSAN